MNRLYRYLAQLRELFTRTIWRGEVLEDQGLRGRAFAILRIASMIWSGIIENKLASRAGALSFSSMLGLGPMIALMVLFSGIVLEKSNPDFAIRQLNDLLTFVAPQIKQLGTINHPEMEELASDDAGEIAAEGDAAGEQDAIMNPELAKLLNSFIEGSQSKAIGIMGSLAVIFIVIQLFSAIESAFNEIWGVRRGRNLLLRIVFYWAVVTLGAVLAFASLTLLSAATLINMIEDLPMGAELGKIFRISGPGFSVALLVVLLTCFYKFIPNTTVDWLSALAGATIVVLLLNLNNFLAFLYLRNVMLSQSLYGSLGIVPIMMLGLYVFWLFLLLGGQITYAVQNANYRSSNKAWHDLNHASRESIALLLLTIICRRFRECRPPYSTPQISRLTRMPNQILNATLQRLMKLRLISQIPPDDDSSGADHRYQPARPLDQIRVRDFREMFEELGTSLNQEIIDGLDPVVSTYHQKVCSAMEQALGDDSLQELIDRLPANPKKDDTQAAAAFSQAATG